jgi:hypothetical protein
MTGRGDTQLEVRRSEGIGCFGGTLAPAAGKRGLRKISVELDRPDCEASAAGATWG